MARSALFAGAGALLAAMQLTPALGQSTVGPFDTYWDATVAGFSDRSAAKQRPAARRKPTNRNGDERNGDNHEGADSENIFGFTEGSDVGEMGEKEFKIDSISGIGRRDGSYLANLNVFDLSYTPFHNLSVALKTALVYHHISDVPGLDGRNNLVFEGLAFEAKYRLIERGLSWPIGLALIIEPLWTRVEFTSGERVTAYGAEFKLAADTELVKGRLFAALNVLYIAERSRVHATGELEKESLLGFSGALSVQVAKGVFFGAEAHYLRLHEGLTLNDHVGHAWFAGPTVYAKLSERCWMSATWTVQVAGRSVENPHLTLDLDHFSRHEARVKLGLQF